MTAASVREVSRGWVAKHGLMYVAQNLAWAGPSQLLVALQIAEWFGDSKEDRLAYIMVLGGLMGLVATPFAGFISDATLRKFEGRTPWIIGGAVGTAAGLLVMSAAPDFGALIVGWLLVQLSLAFTINAAQSAVPDYVPAHQFGMVSGVMGLTYTLAVVLGTALGALLSVREAYIMSAVAIVVGVLPFAATVRGAVPATLQAENVTADDAPEPQTPHPTEAAQSVSSKWLDFSWVFIARFLVTLGNFIALFYLLYYLDDHIGLADPDTGVLILTVVYAVCVLITAVASGAWSDRLGKRIVFVSTSCGGVSIAAALLAVAPGFTVVVVGAAVLGVSWGVFTAVDQALINEVLPDVRTRGRDMGVMNMAVAGPNVLAPATAGWALATFGGYPGLYWAAAALAVVGAVAVLPVRGVK